MDRNYIDLHLLVDRYLRGSLADDEKAAFEERLVWDQELIDELDLADRLRNGLREAVGEDRFVGTRVDVGILRRLTGLLAVPQYAAAASFLLAVTLTAGVLTIPATPDDDTQTSRTVREASFESRRSPLDLAYVAANDTWVDLTTPTEIVPLLVVRSLDVQTISIKEKSWTVLLVDVAGSFDSYRASLSRDEPGAEPFWMLDGLSPTYPDALAIGMPGSALSPGRYVLRLDGLPSQSSESYEHVRDMHFETTLAE